MLLIFRDAAGVRKKRIWNSLKKVFILDFFNRIPVMDRSRFRNVEICSCFGCSSPLMVDNQNGQNRRLVISFCRARGSALRIQFYIKIWISITQSLNYSITQSLNHSITQSFDHSVIRMFAYLNLQATKMRSAIAKRLYRLL